MNSPRVEIIHNRDPDSSCEISVFVDGVLATGYTEYSTDPGSGHDFRDYAESLASDVAQASDPVAAVLYESAMSALQSEYTSDQPDNWDVATRYFDLWIVHWKWHYAKQEACSHLNHPEFHTPSGFCEPAGWQASN